MRVEIKPDLLRWARERAGFDVDDLQTRFAKLAEWEAGDSQPTLKQLDRFASAVHVPIGFLFLDKPPTESLPIPDFRTFDGKVITRPSPNLLDMIYACQERQGWYRDYARVSGEDALDFVGSANLQRPPEEVAADMREVLGFDLEARKDCPTWEEALRMFLRHADEAGVLVMVSGIVFSNTRRKLDVEEFRGFALADPLAPLVFINGSDSKSGQMFTLAHELAHLWLGSTALSNASASPLHGYRREEVWCNKVAAELLAPLALVREATRPDEALPDTLGRLARQFKVSTLVVLRRLLDAGALSRNTFESAWRDELMRLQEISNRGGSGGNFYNSTLSRVSHRFTRALVVSTYEGQTLFRDAYRMLGVRKSATFEELGRKAGVAL
jgi:Zn-dependent peptidase ImmA (M78 family)